VFIAFVHSNLMIFTPNVNFREDLESIKFIKCIIQLGIENRYLIVILFMT